MPFLNITMIAGNKTLKEHHSTEEDLGNAYLMKGKSLLKRGHPRRARASLRIAKQLLPKGQQSNIVSYQLMRTYIYEFLRHPLRTSLIAARKNRLLQPALRLSVRFRITYVSIQDLRCQDKQFSDLLGFSGLPINFFPPFSFFKQSVDNPSQARMDYASWLHRGLVELGGWKIPQSEGGWKNGSLVGLIYERHRSAGVVLLDINSANDDLLNQAIHEKADYYFDLFSSIFSDGYCPSTYPPIYCCLRNNTYYIKDGHHRCAAAAVLGYEEIPVVILAGSPGSS